jgi:hypothetical protein
MRALAAALLVGACASEARVPAPSPVPARADRGFRALTPEGVALVYDARRSVYAVPSQPGAYWLDGRYFRRGADGWLESASATGPWRATRDADVPEGLRSAQ